MKTKKIKKKYYYHPKDGGFKEHISVVCNNCIVEEYINSPATGWFRCYRDKDLKLGLYSLTPGGKMIPEQEAKEILFTGLL